LRTKISAPMMWQEHWWITTSRIVRRTCSRCHGNPSIPADCKRASDVIPRIQSVSAS